MLPFAAAMRRLLWDIWSVVFVWLFVFFKGVDVGYSVVMFTQHSIVSLGIKRLCGGFNARLLPVASYCSEGTPSFAAFHLHTADQSHMRLGQACLEDLGLVWRHCSFEAAVLHAQLKLRVIYIYITRMFVPLQSAQDHFNIYSPMSLES